MRSTTGIPLMCVPVLLIATAAAPAHAQFEVPLDEPRSIHPVVDYIYDDDEATLVTDGAGNWVAAWLRTEWRCNSTQHVFVSVTSLDGGVTWSSPTPLDTTGQLEPSGAFTPSIATDANGNWLAVWESKNPISNSGFDRDILFAKSVDNGLTWSLPALVNQDAPFDGSRLDRFPQVTTDGSGRWMVVWYASASGPDKEIYVAETPDDGATWSDPTFVNTDALLDSRDDWFPRLATDGNGTWVVVWAQLGGGGILQARSIAPGVWSDPRYLAGDDNAYPRLATDGAGNWMAVWATWSGELGNGEDDDVAFSVSTDGGETWTPPGLLNTTGMTDSDHDLRAWIATDRRGNWVAVWPRRDDQGGAVPVDIDLLVARSTDLGATWTDPEIFTSDPELDDVFDSRPRMATDGIGNWRVIWVSSNHATTAMFRLPFVTTCPTDADGDGYGTPGDPACPLGDTEDCDDSDRWIAPSAPQACDGLNNDCTDVAWPALSGRETDDDGDGLSECAGDCSDTDAGSWERPGRVEVMLGSEAGQTVLAWSLPDPPGGSAQSFVYDVVRSTDASFCFSGEECLASNQPETTAADDLIPDPWATFFYLVRPQNACGPGPLGHSLERYFGTPPRVAVDCP